MLALFDLLWVCFVLLPSLPLGYDLLTSLSFEVAGYIGPEIAKRILQTALDE